MGDYPEVFKYCMPHFIPVIVSQDKSNQSIILLYCELPSHHLPTRVAVEKHGHVPLVCGAAFFDGHQVLELREFLTRSTFSYI